MANPNTYGVTPRDFLRDVVKVQSRMSEFTHEIIVHEDIREAKIHVAIIIRHDGAIIKTEETTHTPEEFFTKDVAHVGNTAMQLEFRAHELKTEAYRFIYIDEL
jgi:hypothetical protein